MTCFICGTEFGMAVGHPYRCASKKRPELEHTMVRYLQLCHDTGHEWTKDEIVIPYLQGNALPFFRKRYGLAYSQAKFLLDFFGAKQRTHRESVNLTSMIERRKSTCMAKYGVTNPSCSDKIKAKKVVTFRRHFGADNVFSTDAFREKLNETMLAKYGKMSVPDLHGNADSFGWSKASPEEKALRIYKAHRGYIKWYGSLTEEERIEYVQKRCVNGYKSSLEERVCRILHELKIEVKRQFFLSKRSYDFRICGCPLLIEINGDFWHANPDIYCADDVLSHPGRLVKASELWHKDMEKEEVARRWGYKLLTLWESFIKRSSDAEVASVVVSCLEDTGDENKTYY
jgi:hypothetical protein